ncbi:hypothetical protein HYT84_04285 [Candidatus Micrarchaeota archaeon]|nr:hypothetical protein [Candidatus Micrarchaeota archaeon]
MKNEPLKIQLIYVKDKQAFVKEEGVLRLIGKPIELANKWKKEGIKLIHIIDLDASLGSSTNFDLYNSLTYLINIQVEGVKDEKLLEKLLSIGARVVVSLPTKIDLRKFEDKKKLLVGKINAVTNTESVHDLILESESKEILELAKGRRLIVFGEKKRKFEAFGVII